MKISITYLPCEGRKARVIEEFIKQLEPGVKVRKSDRNAPYTHIYITTKKPETPCGSMRNA